MQCLLRRATFTSIESRAHPFDGRADGMGNAWQEILIRGQLLRPGNRDCMKLGSTRQVLCTGDSDSCRCMGSGCHFCRTPSGGEGLKRRQFELLRARTFCDRWVKSWTMGAAVNTSPVNCPNCRGVRPAELWKRVSHYECARCWPHAIYITL